MGFDPISLTATTAATAAATTEAAASAAAQAAAAAAGAGELGFAGIGGGAAGAMDAALAGMNAGAAGGTGALESLLAAPPSMFGAPVTGAEALGGGGAGSADFMASLATPPQFGIPELVPGALGEGSPSWMAQMQGKLGGMMADPQVRAGLTQGGLAMMNSGSQPRRASPPPMMGQMPGAGSIGSPAALGAKPMMGGPGAGPGSGQSFLASRMRGLGR